MRVLCPLWVHLRKRGAERQKAPIIISVIGRASERISFWPNEAVCVYLEMMCYLLHGPFSLVRPDYRDAGQSATQKSGVGFRRVLLWGAPPIGADHLRRLIKTLGVDWCGVTSGNCARVALRASPSGRYRRFLLMHCRNLTGRSPPFLTIIAVLRDRLLSRSSPDSLAKPAEATDRYHAAQPAKPTAALPPAFRSSAPLKLLAPVSANAWAIFYRPRRAPDAICPCSWS